MDREVLDNIMRVISKGNTSAVEALFNKPGGRKYLERMILVMVCTLPFEEQDKEDLLTTFQKAMGKLEKRIRRQHEGQKILKQLYDQ